MSSAQNPATPAAETGNRGMLGAWQTGELPPPPPGGWQTWKALLGPGVLLAGASVGSGEWLSGPAVSAQYGGLLLWVATLSIIAQVFCNLEMMRYTLYCGEPIVVGFFRTWPGPRLWTVAYLLLDFAAIWPFNASNAAVPLAAALLGHLPGGEAPTTLLGLAMTERDLVQLLGYAIFLTAFLPLIFGGTIYRMLERVMAFKLVVVLGYLVFAVALTASRATVREVCEGFVDFGAVPLRADTIVDGRHFNLWQSDGERAYRLKGTLENGQVQVTGFVVERAGAPPAAATSGVAEADLPAVRAQMLRRAEELVDPRRFYVETREDDAELSLSGEIDADHRWRADRWEVAEGGRRQAYHRLDDVPEPWAEHFRELAERRGLRKVRLVAYVAEHRQLPLLDWAMVATLAAIAGAGGMTNTLFSNYTRDKGWGMGAHVGAIPSAIGGRQIKLSHVGMVFRFDDQSRQRWHGWFRHILKDQLGIWMAASFIGMALPCMLSLEFIRNAPVAGDRVAAMVAEGMADRYPSHRTLLWAVTLSVGFLILAPGQIVSGDQLARRWTDIIWTSSRWAKHIREDHVKYVYYAILAAYGAWGLVALTLFDPIQILKLAGVLMDVALGFAAWHTLYVNVALLPRELRPNWLMRLGTFACGAFFWAVSVIVVWTL
ncbi:MAG TPA: Nramp family divalent metal transporter [Pirellulales bacterium]|nr:Nramp family divalent metal transporter [Pirellulales bacterium]